MNGFLAKFDGDAEDGKFEKMHAGNGEPEIKLLFRVWSFSRFCGRTSEETPCAATAIAHGIPGRKRLYAPRLQRRADRKNPRSLRLRRPQTNRRTRYSLRGESRVALNPRRPYPEKIFRGTVAPVDLCCFDALAGLAAVYGLSSFGDVYGTAREGYLPIGRLAKRLSGEVRTKYRALHAWRRRYRRSSAVKPYKSGRDVSGDFSE
jgi:hypothetical protein